MGREGVLSKNVPFADAVASLQGSPGIRLAKSPRINVHVTLTIAVGIENVLDGAKPTSIFEVSESCFRRYGLRESFREHHLTLALRQKLSRVR